MLCLVCIPGVSRLLCGSSSRCHGLICSLLVWYFLIILTYYFWGVNLKSGMGFIQMPLGAVKVTNFTCRESLFIRLTIIGKWVFVDLHFFVFIPYID